ncbi:MAG TPA: hypothetical protein PKG90_00160 [Chitinophagaceae bacterium]|nr:hypothetical protein [Chitinophagaceae bacterium]HNU15376.1 hypothetical protein [Chitinophagaceae bacterium]
MTKLLMILCIGVMMPATGISQKDTTFRVVRTLKGDIVDFTVDNLDNVYILNSRNQVKKYNANGDSVAIYNDIRKYGRATLIDVSNPLKVLLYYRDFATVVMLDRFLNVVNIVDLRKQNIFQAKVIAQSYDNKIWVFDEMENKLKKIDEDGKLLQETPDFRLFMDKTIVPVEVADENKYVYLYDSTAGVYVFDYFGTLNNVIMIHHWQNLKITGNYIFGSRSDTLFRYDIKTFLYDEWKIPEQVKDAGTFNFTTSRLYALRKECEKEQNCISIYAIR